MRLEVLELSQPRNTQHHYPAGPYHSVLLRLWDPVPLLPHLTACWSPLQPHQDTQCNKH